MDAYCDNRHRTTVRVVAWVLHPLVVEAQERPAPRGKFVVGLGDLLRTRTGQLPIADENAETARVQEAFAYRRNSVPDGGDADGVFGAPPQRSPLIEAPTAAERSMSVNS